MTWKHPPSPTTQKFKLESMATMFWDCEGLLLCEFLPPKTTINSDKYCEAGKIFEDQNALHKAVVQYFTSLGKEHYREGMFKLAKR
jgi:hypothetical protein